MAFAATDIGPTYDLGLATRDGSSLTVKDKDGNNAAVPSMAYMTSVNPQRQQLEETELQHKDRLIQLSSSNLIDREFDQWPQATQGDWSGGELQRVFQDPVRYWRGQGVLWPISDYLPQQGLLPAPIVAANQAVNPGIISSSWGPVGGDLAILANSGLGTGWAYWTHDQTSNFVVVTIRSGDNTYNSANDPFGTTVPPDDMCIAAGHLWVVSHDAAGVKVWGDNNGVAGFGLVQLIAGTAGFPGLAIAAAQIGTHIYVAVAYLAGVPSAGPAKIRIYDLLDAGGGGVWTINGSTDLTFAYPTIPSSLTFQGDNLIITLAESYSSVSTFTPMVGYGTTLVSYNIPAATITTIANIQGACYLCNIAGGLFVVSAQVMTGIIGQTTSNQQLAVDLYLLQGASLQHIGPLPPPNYFGTVTRPVSFGPYALFSTISSPTAGAGKQTVWAYDVLRGRLFEAWSSAAAYGGGLLCINSMAAIASATRTAPGAHSFFAQWGVVVAAWTAANTVTFQEIYFGISPNAVPATPIQQPVDIISSMIDFGSPATNKLFRQAIVSFLPLGADPLASVTLNIWLDQDVSMLSGAPDFTTTIAGLAPNAAVKQLALPINRMARKLVYEVVTTGGKFGAAAWINAPKLITVGIQVATGWVQTLYLDLSPNSRVNSQNTADYCFQRQGADHVQAYNFLKQLWRQKGGQVVVTLPNGDTGNWILQDIHFESSKPFAASFRADQQASLQFVATVKMREDI